MTQLVRSVAELPAATTGRGPILATLGRIAVRLIVAIGLGLVALVFLEAWLPGVVVAVVEHWLAG